MSSQDWVEFDQHATEVSFRIDRLARLSQRQLLYAIWEKYLLDVLQPIYRLLLHKDDERLATRSEENKRMLRKGILLHPFNLEDDEVNLDRAGKLLLYLRSMRRTLKPWWPQDAVALVKVVKKEREEMDAYGYILGVGGRQRDTMVAPGDTSVAELPIKPQRTI